MAREDFLAILDRQLPEIEVSIVNHRKGSVRRFQRGKISLGSDIIRCLGSYEEAMLLVSKLRAEYGRYFGF